MQFGQDPTQTMRPTLQCPDLDPRSVQLLAHHTGQPDQLDQPNLRLGLPVWGDKQWVGSVYPPKTPASGFLKAYAAQFQAIELNATFYKIPEPHVIDRWIGDVGPDFKFVPKWPRRISHEFHLAAWRIDAFFEWVEALKRMGDKLGTSFLQLPPTAPKSHWPRLQQLLKEAQACGLPTAVEFRHESWFTGDQRIVPDVLESLAELGVDLVVSDTIGRPDVAHRSLSTSRLVVRFLGTNLGPDEQARLASWGDRLQIWASQGLREVYFFCHEPDNVLSPRLHSKVVDLWRERLGWRLPAWQTFEPAPDLFSRN